jgi:hypothetical protein
VPLVLFFKSSWTFLKKIKRIGCKCKHNFFFAASLVSIVTNLVFARCSKQNRTQWCRRNEATLLVPSVPKRQVAHSLSGAASVPILGIFSHKGPWQRWLEGLWGHYLTTSRSGACKCGHKATWGAPISLWNWLPAFPHFVYKNPCLSSVFILLLCPLHLCPLL